VAMIDAGFFQARKQPDALLISQSTVSQHRWWSQNIYANQEKSPSGPYPFLVHPLNPEGRDAASFIPAVWYQYLIFCCCIGWLVCVNVPVLPCC